MPSMVSFLKATGIKALTWADQVKGVGSERKVGDTGLVSLLDSRRKEGFFLALTLQSEQTSDEVYSLTATVVCAVYLVVCR